MSVQEQNKAIAQQYIDAINVDDFEKLRELLLPEFVDHASVGDLPPGLEGVEQAHRMLRTGFPDVRFTIDQLVAEGDKVAMIATGQGAHNGDFIGLAPTGNRVSWIGSGAFASRTARSPRAGASSISSESRSNRRHSGNGMIAAKPVVLFKLVVRSNGRLRSVK